MFWRPLRSTNLGYLIGNLSVIFFCQWCMKWFFASFISGVGGCLLILKHWKSGMKVAGPLILRHVIWPLCIALSWDNSSQVSPKTNVHKDGRRRHSLSQQIISVIGPCSFFQPRRERVSSFLRLCTRNISSVWVSNQSNVVTFWHMVIYF